MALCPLFVSSVRGAMHIDRDIPKEDAGQILEEESCHIFVTADGHGDKTCFRSAQGSAMAVEITIQKMNEFSKSIESNQLIGELFVSLKREQRIRQLITSIVAGWNERLLEDVEKNPFTEEELIQCGKNAEYYKNNENVSHVYGTTLLAGLLTEEYLLLIHQGDGRCVVVDSDGKAYEPVSWDEKCIDNITTSLCDTDVIHTCRYTVLSMRENPPIACFLCSDGVEDSFATIEQTYGFCRNLICLACETGLASMQEQLPELLEQLNTVGSRDDTTVSGFINVEESAKFVGYFAELDEKLSLESALKKVEDKLLSMSRKKEYLENQFKEATEKRIALENAAEQKQSFISEISDRLKRLQEHLSGETEEWEKSKEDLSNTKNSLEMALKKEKNIESECTQYLERYQFFEQEKERLLYEIARLGDKEEDQAEEIVEEPNKNPAEE